MILNYLRRLFMTVGVVTILSCAFGLFVALKKPKMLDHTILEVTFDGPLKEGPEDQVSRLLGAGDETPPLITLVNRIRAAAEDRRVDGLLLHIKSPSLGLAQAEEIGRAVDFFAAANKWTGSYMETAGEGSRGDGAFLLASMANQVYLAPPGEINLMGVRTDVPFGKEALKKLRIKAHVEQRYEYKNYAETFVEKGFTEAHRESLKSLMDDMQERICELLAKGRRTDVATVKRWIFEAPFNSEGALNNHLIDHVGYWDDVEKAVSEAASGREDALMDISGYQPKKQSKKGVPIALIVGEGEINRGESRHSPVGNREHIGSKTYAEAFKAAREDHVRGVLLRIDSPGGSYIASDLLRREVELTRDQNIPVVVSMGSVAASGGYFMAMGADHVVAETGTITGSIGVVSVAFAVREALGTLGLTFDSYASVPAPSATSFLDPLEGEGLVRMQREVDRIYKDFVSKVAQGRHISYDDAHKVAKGRVWTGRQALARGLVDELGGMDMATNYLRRRLDLTDKDAIELVNYPEPETPWSLLRELADGQVASARAMRGLMPTVQPILGWAKNALAPKGIQAAAPEAQHLRF